MPNELPVLSYPGPLTRAGVSEVRSGEKVVVILPRRPFLRFSGLTGRALSACIGLVIVVPQLFVRGAASSTLFPLVASCVIIIVIAAMLLSSKPVKIEINRDSVLIFNLAVPNDEKWDPVITRPRNAVYRVYYRAFANALFIRAHGHEMVEIPLNYPDLAMEALAERLRLHLQLVQEVENGAEEGIGGGENAQ